MDAKRGLDPLSAGSVGTASERTLFVGRDSEMEVLQAAIGQAFAGTLRAVFVEGEPGIGKSRLISEAQAQAHEAGAHVLRGKCEELERSLPFGAVRQLLDPSEVEPNSYRAQMAQTLRETLFEGQPRGVDVRYRVVEDMLDFVEKLATSAPVTIVLDDLHWADDSSLLVLSSLCRRLVHLPVVVLGTYRPLPTNDDLAALIDVLIPRVAALRLRLAPLNKEETSTLTASLLGPSVAPWSEEVLAAAGGYPLLMIELARVLAQDTANVDREATAVDLLRDPTLRSTVLRRLDHISARTREMLQVASVLGTTFDVSHLALVLNRPVAELLPGLEEARRTGIVVEGGGRLAFEHDLIRLAVYEDIPPPVRRALHLDVGRALARSGLPPIDVANHLVLGAAKGDKETVKWLCEAGWAAAPRSPATAVGLFEAALRLLDRNDPERDSVIAALIPGLIASGRLSEAESLTRHVLGRPHDASLTESIRPRLVHILLLQGKVEEQLRESLNVNEGMSLAAAARLKAGTVSALIQMGRLAEAGALAPEARAMAERSQDADAILKALHSSWAIPAAEGRLAEAIGAAELWAQRALELTGWPALNGLAFVLTHADRLEEAKGLVVEARLAAEDEGDVTVLVTCHWRLLNLHFLAGEWDSAMAEGEAALAVSRETGLHGGIAKGCSVLAEIALRRNDLEGAEQYLDVVEAERGSALVRRPVAPVSHIRGLLAEARNDTAGARRELQVAWDRSVETGVLRSLTEVGPDFARLLVSIDDRSTARAVAEQAAISAERQATASAKGAALRCRGLADSDPSTLQQAVETMETSPRVLARADTLRDAGTASIAASPTEAGVALLKEALLVYQRLGAEYDVRAVEAMLRSAGVSFGRRGARARPATGWQALTKTEYDVLVLIAQGLTAREAGGRLFISPRTVETHVAHIFAKLGCSSRAEVRAMFAKRPDPFPAAPAKP